MKLIRQKLFNNAAFFSQKPDSMERAWDYSYYDEGNKTGGKRSVKKDEVFDNVVKANAHDKKLQKWYEKTSDERTLYARNHPRYKHYFLGRGKFQVDVDNIKDKPVRLGFIAGGSNKEKVSAAYRDFLKAAEGMKGYGREFTKEDFEAMKKEIKAQIRKDAKKQYIMKKVVPGVGLGVAAAGGLAYGAMKYKNKKND